MGSRVGPRFARIASVYNLAHFGFRDMMDCRTRLRAIFDEDPATLAVAAERVVRFFYDGLLDDRGKPACALVRMFKTHRFADLDADSQSVALRVFPGASGIPELRCLTLLATAGDQPEWNQIQTSRGHRVIPLPSEEMVQEAPMIAQLITQLGGKIANVLRPDPALLFDNTSASYNLFYVPMALGSPYIVAQKEFVEDHRIASVLGFGGLLASGDFFAAILFSHVPIGPQVADLFKVVGLNLKVAFLPLARKPMFS